jgi:hypothetical protein
VFTKLEYLILNHSATLPRYHAALPSFFAPLAAFNVSVGSNPAAL